MAAGELPYGDQRKLEIARAMCTRPLLLCLDEPAAGLNARETEALNELLYSIRDEEGIALLLIEHDMSVVMRISDHIVVLDYGKEIADGTAEEVRNDPQCDRRLSRRARRGAQPRSNRRCAYERAPASRCSNVTACYGVLPVLHDVSLDIHPRRDRGADRRERRRQDHLDDDDLRAPAREPRAASCSTASDITDLPAHAIAQLASPSRRREGASFRA